jgi:molybdopterin/thiamine biosynthesis adenylyltransferase
VDPNDQPVDLSKYARQTVLPGVGAEGQRRLLGSHAVLIGCGTLGGVIADQLCRAGVGHLTVIDRDLVEPGNLQRQVLFDQRHAGVRMPKAEAAQARIAEINGDVRVEAVVADLRPSNAESLVMRGRFGLPGVILDGTDNFETRYLVNDLSVKHAIPYIYGGVVGTRGMRAVFNAGAGSPCLRCVFDAPPAPGSQPTCETAGVLSPAAAIVGAMQAAEAIKVIVGTNAAGDLVEVDPWSGLLRRVDLSRSKDPACPCCGSRRFEFLESPDPEAAALCGRNAVQVMPSGKAGGRVDLDRLAETLGAVGTVSRTVFMVRASPTDQPGVTLAVFRDGRAVIEGVEDPARARALYARYIGA